MNGKAPERDTLERACREMIEEFVETCEDSAERHDCETCAYCSAGSCMAAKVYRARLRNLGLEVG